MVSQPTIVNVVLALTVAAMLSLGGLAYNYQPGGSASVIPSIAEMRPISSPALDVGTFTELSRAKIPALNVRFFASSLPRNELAIRTHEILLKAGYTFNFRNFKKPVIAATDIVLGTYTKVGSPDIAFQTGSVNANQREPISLFQFLGANPTNTEDLARQLRGANSFIGIFTGTGLQRLYAENGSTPIIEEIS